MPTRDRRAGPNGARRPQRAAERALRAATLHGMIYRTQWGERHTPADERSHVGRTERPEDPTAAQFDAHLFPERPEPGLLPGAVPEPSA